MANQRTVVVIVAVVVVLVVVAIAVALGVVLSKGDKGDAGYKGDKMPGLLFRPQPDPGTNIVSFNQGLSSSYRAYMDDMQEILLQYERDHQQGEMYMDCSNGVAADETHACVFDSNMLGSTCTLAEDFGYYEGMPCILLMMNQIEGWTPEDYANGSVPDAIADRYVPGSIGVSCGGVQSQDNIGPMEYFPKAGFGYEYFPYRNQSIYRSPLVMVQFRRPVPGVVLEVWCRAWARNIEHNLEEEIGGVRFFLRVD